MQIPPDPNLVDSLFQKRGSCGATRYKYPDWDVQPARMMVRCPNPFGHPVCTWCVLAEGISIRTVRSSCSQRELLVVNCELDPECVDPELRLVLQWIAASELGLQALYFRWSREMITAKVHSVTQPIVISTLLFFFLYLRQGAMCLCFFGATISRCCFSSRGCSSTCPGRLGESLISLELLFNSASSPKKTMQENLSPACLTGCWRTTRLS